MPNALVVAAFSYKYDLNLENSFNILKFLRRKRFLSEN